MMNKVKTAVIGCGMISNIYLRNLSKLFSIIDLTAVCDLNPAAAQRQMQTFGVPMAMTIDEAAADPEIELVVNLTPPTAHYAVIKQMLLAGKHVYTEKMFTTRLEDARELVALAKEKGLMIAVAPDTVLGAGVQTARGVLDSGLIGRVTSGFVCVKRNQLLNSEVFRFLQKDGGAIPYDVGIYYIGALIALLGPVKAVSAFTAPALRHEKQLLFNPDNADAWVIPGSNVVTASLAFESGALVSVLFDGNAAGSEQSRFELFGTKGSMKVGDPDTFGGETRVQLAESEEFVFPFTHGYNGKNTVDEPQWFDAYGSRGVGVAELAYAIRGNRPNRLSMEYGLHCEEILLGMDIAAQTGATYEVKSSAEVRPLAAGYFSTLGPMRGDAELSLVE